MRERLGTLSAKCNPKIFQNVLWEAAAINAQELATAKPCLLVVGTLEQSRGGHWRRQPPLCSPLCMFLAESFYLLRLNSSRPVKGFLTFL